jgi:hypothetical protein
LALAFQIPELVTVTVVSDAELPAVQDVFERDIESVGGT